MGLITSLRTRLCLELLTQRCLLSTYGLADTVQVSQDDPFAKCTADDVRHQAGTLYPSTSLETFMAVDPTNSDHIAGIWQQDRWSNGGARDLEVGISFDGGLTWLDEPLPGLTLCAGGPDQRASDPWIAFAANGDLYATALRFGPEAPVVTVSKSTDGGITWQDPVVIPSSSNADKEAIVTDPNDPQTAYVVWTGAFSRTTDGGQTFSSPRGLPTGTGSQLAVLPDGTLVDADGCAMLHSTDQGQTWGPRIPIPNCHSQRVIDPNTHQPERAGLGIPDLAVDPKSGTLYFVIEDSSFSGNQFDNIALTQSTDDGYTWSRPVPVNQTPTDLPPLDQQAFIPSVQVAADGSIGVAYYDFRNNQGGPDLPTDYWFVPGTPDGSGGITWGNELRLTDNSFDFEQAPFAAYGDFIGDYQGRASAGLDMLTMFGHPDQGLGDVIFFRRVMNLGDSPGRAGRHINPVPRDLAASMRLDTATVSFPIFPAQEDSTQQPLPAHMPMLSESGRDSPDGSLSPIDHGDPTQNQAGVSRSVEPIGLLDGPSEEAVASADLFRSSVLS